MQNQAQGSTASVADTWAILASLSNSRLKKRLSSPTSRTTIKAKNVAYGLNMQPQPVMRQSLTPKRLPTVAPQKPAPTRPFPAASIVAHQQTLPPMSPPFNPVKFARHDPCLRYHDIDQQLHLPQATLGSPFLGVLHEFRNCQCRPLGQLCLLPRQVKRTLSPCHCFDRSHGSQCVCSPKPHHAFSHFPQPQMFWTAHPTPTLPNGPTSLLSKRPPPYSATHHPRH